MESVSMAEEMGILAAEMSYLAERRTAFENLGLRTGLGSRSFAHHRPFAVREIRHAARDRTSGSQARKVATIDSRSLEKKAAALPPVLTVPMILFFLPGLFAAILTPAIVQINNWN